MIYDVILCLLGTTLCVPFIPFYIILACVDESINPCKIAARKYNSSTEIKKRRKNADQIIEEHKTNYCMKSQLIHITNKEQVWSKPSSCISSSERIVKLHKLMQKHQNNIDTI